MSMPSSRLLKGKKNEGDVWYSEQSVATIQEKPKLVAEWKA